MNAEEFYDEYKAALVFLGLSWATKEQAVVWCDAGSFYMSANGKQVRIQMETH